jgi:hypothetical protein
MQYLTFENLIVAALIIGGLVFVLKWAGVWEKLLGTGKEKLNHGVDGMTNAVEKQRMKVRTLKPLLESLGQQMTDLDGKYGKANGERARAIVALDKEKSDLQNVFSVLKDPKNLSEDESTTVQSHKDKVLAAAALVKAKEQEIAGLAVQAKALHEQYTDKEREFQSALAAIPQVEARQVVIDSKRTAVAFAAKMKEFDEAAKMGSDVASLQDEEDAKLDAELKRQGGVKSETDKAAEKAARAKSEGDVLKDLGIEDPTAK